MPIVLPSGPVIEDPANRLMRFCEEEYAYYDAVASSDPNTIAPVDVLVTVAVNSWITNAAQARRVHRGIAERCDPLLDAIPEDADLLTWPAAVMEGARLLDAAIEAWGVQTAVATKVLHRKRRRLVPMLDGVLVEHYRRALGVRSAGHADLLRAFQTDLRAVAAEVDTLVASLAAVGFGLSPVRALEILLWTEVEERNYYRGTPSRDPRIR